MRTLLHVALLGLAVMAPAESLDWRMQRAVQASRTAAMERPMRVATDIGKPVLVIGALVAIAVLDRAQGVATLRTAVVTLVPTNLAVEGLKRLTGRTRPDGDHTRSNTSMPSSHAANAFAIAWVLARRWRRAAPGLFVFAALVAYSRVYLDRHFVSDVVVGASIGMLCGWAAPRWPWPRPPRTPAPVTGAEPPA